MSPCQHSHGGIMALQSERMTKSATLSYSGSRYRIWTLLRADNAWLRWLLSVPAAALLVALAWVVVTLWYVLWAVGGFIFFLPARLLGRGRRKRRLEQARHREQIDAARGHRDEGA